MRHVLIICVLVLSLSLTQAKQKADIQKPEVTKLEVVDLGETEEPDSVQPDVQRKRNSGYSYNIPNRIFSQLRFQTNQSKGSRIHGQLTKPFTRYGLPNHSDTTTQGYQQYRNKLQYHVGQQQPINFSAGLQQEVPSPIRNVDFAEVNPIASQNNEPFGMHTANYLPPQNQKLPAYSTDNFAQPQSSLGHGHEVHDTNSHSQNFIQTQNHQISDAAFFLSENAQAIQQLYGAPASNQDFAPSYDHFQNQNSNGQFKDFESTSQNPQEFRNALPSYAVGTLNPQETLEQIQSLEKDRLIVQLQQALAQAQPTPSTVATGRYAQNQASFIQNQELLASISQQMKLHVPTTPQTVALGSSGSTVFSESPFLPGTTINPLGFPLNYGVPTTAQTPTTTTVATGVSTTLSQPSQSSAEDGTAQVTSSSPAPNQLGSPAAGSPVGIPLYSGFVPTFVAGTNFIPSYSTNVLTSSGPVRPVQSPTHFGIPIPTEPPQIPASATTIPTTVSPSNRPGIALTPAISSAALPVQPIRPVTTPLQPVASPLHPVLPTNLVQVHPLQAASAVTTGAQSTYGLQTALINPVLYKPVKAIYPLYYYPNVAYQLQKSSLPSYAPSYAQAKPAQIWK